MAGELRSLRDRCLAATRDELTWGPVAVQLCSPIATHRTWFHAYLQTTHPTPELPVRHRYRVFADEDAERYARLVEHVSALPTVPAQDYTGRPYLHGHDDAATYWLTREPADLRGDHNPYVVAHHNGDWYVVSLQSALAPGNPTLVARELLRWHLLAGGALVVHASSAWSGGAGMLFCGDAGSGKTTLALAVGGAGGRFVSGDRTALLPAGDGLAVAGTAMAARVRAGTLTGLGLDRRLRQRQPLRMLPGKELLTQTELESLCAIDTTAAAPLAAAVFTRRVERREPCLEELTPDEMYELIEPQQLTYDNEWPQRWLLAGLGSGEPPPVTQRREHVLRHLAKIRSFRLTWDPHLGGTTEAVSAVVAGLGGD